MTAYDDEVTADSPVLYLPLDDPSGTTAVATVGSNGTYAGSPTLRITGPGPNIPYGISTDGVNDSVATAAVGSLGGTTAQTWEFWAKAPATIDQSAAGRWMMRETTGGGGFAYGSSTGNLTNEVSQVTQTLSPGGSGERTGWTGYSTDTAWHHHVFVFNGTKNGWTHYVDGAAVGTKIANDGGCYGFPAGRSFYLARLESATFYAWDGIAGFAVYPSALSGARILAHYEAGIDDGLADEVFAAVAFQAEASVSFRPSTLAAVAFNAAAALTVAPPVTVVEWASVSFLARARLAFVTRIEGDQWRLVAVDLNQTPVAEIENAKISTVVDDLNGEGAIEFTLPVIDPKAAHLPPLQEVQVWKGDSLLKQGPVFRPQANSRSLGFSGAGLEWYFLRRHFGKADRTNYAVNGDFEDGLAGWTVPSLQSPLEPLANRPPNAGAYQWAIRTNRKMTGRRSLYLNGPSDTVPKYGWHASQGFIWEVDEVETPEGEEWTFVAYCYIPSSSYRGPGFNNGGIGIRRVSLTLPLVYIAPEGGGPAVGYPQTLEFAQATIDDNTPRDAWHRLEVTLEAPVTGDAEFVVISLFGIRGAIHWDRATLARNEATRFYSTDQAAIAEGIVEHLQDPDFGKSDLNIETDCQPTGVLRDRVYLHSEHANGKGALDNLTDLEDGLDYSVDVTPTTRTFRTHYPQKGVDHLDLVLEYGKNVEDFTWAFDGAVASNQVITLGSGDGSAREEGVATDLTALGGKTLEEVYVAIEGADIASLDNRAADRLEVIKNPTIVELHFKNTTLAGILTSGDRARVRIDRGYVQVDAIYRVVRTTISPANDKMSVVANVYYED